MTILVTGTSPRNYVSIKEYGAVCDGVTDDTAAIQAAINAAIAANKALLIDPSSSGSIVKQNGANVYCLLINGPLQVYGVPGFSIIKPHSTVADTVSVFYCTGSTSINYAPTVFDSLFIGDPAGSTRKGLHAIVFDTTAAGASFFRPIVRNCYLQPPATSAGSSIYATNSAANNSGGGLAYGLFEHNHVGSGISLNLVGDSIRVCHNVFFGSTGNDAIYANLVTNAGNLQVIGNNFGANSRFLKVDQAVSFVCTQNEIEHNNTGSTNAAVDINGGTSTINSGNIVNNQIQALTGTGGTPTLIRVNAATGVVIDNNRIATPTDYTPITITASASGTYIGGSNTFSGMTTPVSDSGSGTRQILTSPYAKAPLVLLNTLTASSSASLSDTTSLTSSYNNYLVVYENVLPATTATILEMQVSTNAGVSYLATSYVSQAFGVQAGTNVNGTLTTAIPLTRCDAGVVASTAGYGVSGQLWIHNPSGSTTRKIIEGKSSFLATSGDACNIVFGGYQDGGNTAVNAIKFLFSSGNIASGTFRIYGVN